jgi:hypothetical protein
MANAITRQELTLAHEAAAAAREWELPKALLTVGLQFCDEIDELAPKTRPKRGMQVELTASSLIVRADRLRPLLERASHGVTADQVELIEQLTSRMVEILGDWRVRTTADPAVAMKCDQARERGGLFLSLLRRAQAQL